MAKPKQRHLSIVYARMTKRKPRHLNIVSACLSRPKPKLKYTMSSQVYVRVSQPDSQYLKHTLMELSVTYRMYSRKHVNAQAAGTMIGSKVQAICCCTDVSSCCILLDICIHKPYSTVTKNVHQAIPA